MLGPFSDSYVGRTASDDTFSGLVPHLERSPFVGHHHALGHVVQHGLEKARFLPQFFFQPLVLGACLDEL